MKKLIYILFVIILSGEIYAADYYFADDGNDGDAGTEVAPWQTVAKMQTTIDAANAGDVIYLERGSVWYQAELDPSGVSGSAGNRIRITTFGTGAMPVLSGEKALSSYSVSSDVYTYVDSDIGAPNIDPVTSRGYRFPSSVTIDGDQVPTSREPDDSYLFSSNVSSYWLQDTESWDTDEWKGGWIALKSVKWEWSIVNITGNTSTTLTTTGHDTLAPWQPSGEKYYYFLNALAGCDEQDEWASTEDTLWIYSPSGAPSTVLISTVDTCMNFVEADYWQIDSIEFRGFNMFGAHVKRSDSVGFNYCRFSDIGHAGVFYWGTIAVPPNAGDTEGGSVTNCEFIDCLNNSILLKFCEGGDITGNYIHRNGIQNGYFNLAVTDYISGNHLYSIAASNNLGGNSVNVRRNFIDSTGGGILTHLNASNFYFEDNLVRNYGLTELSDMGGFYGVSDPTSSVGAYCKNNFFLDVHWPLQTIAPDEWGTARYTDRFTHPIYFDQDTYNYKGDSNSIENCATPWVTNGGINRSYKYNIILNFNTPGLHPSSANAVHNSYSIALENAEHTASYDTVMYNTFIWGGIAAGGYSFHRTSSYSCTFPLYSAVDHNKYFDPNSVSYDVARCFTSGSETYSDNMAEWQSRTFSCLDGGQDPGDNSTYNNVAYTEAKLFKNFSASDYEFTLTSTYVDKDGNSVGSSITVPPFYSVPLFVTSVSTSTDDDLYIDTTLVPLLRGVDQISDPCEYRVQVYDTTTVIDSTLWEFETNLAATYGDITLTNAGTIGYDTDYACDGVYCLDADFPNSTEELYSSSVDMGDSIVLSFLYATWATNSGFVMAANKGASGTGWEIQRFTGGHVLFITENSSGSIDTSSSQAGVIGGSAVCYDIQIRISKTYGFASILVDGAYVTSNDSSIRTDFNTNGSFSFMSDADGGRMIYSFLDSLQVKYFSETITQYDSCVTSVSDTISAFDTTYYKDYNFIGESSSKFYDASCADTVVFVYNTDYVAFYNIDFGDGATKMEIGYSDAIPSDISFGYLTTEIGGDAVGTFISEPAYGCTTLSITLTEPISGVNDLYLYGTLTVEYAAGLFYWFRFYNEYSGLGEQWKLPSQYKILQDSGRWRILSE